ncbi:sulfide/dihydroorotate dehydrogenase-like FAD/NAD-binding protein [Candidatus Bipolaricaulota bacterium]|nr:sulfide/dihydroorotate dehydrogenase-like FAD/NAD-binding protein [Candidatus Bipolaricaulota bacterium]
MKKIIRKTEVASGVCEYQVEAPLIAESHQAGQFVVLRLHEKGERFPLTIAKSDTDRGSITLVVQSAGKSTMELNNDFSEGDEIRDLAGPLGNPSEIETYGDVAVIGGGVGIALIYPVARALSEAGNRVISIIGAQSKDKLFYRDKIGEISDELVVTTDDGSVGKEGFTSEGFRELLERTRIDKSWAIGPVPMMRACARVAEEGGTELMVSLNTIMVDGTGMCGGCRVEVDGEAQFACVDGPEFLAESVNFKLLSQRIETYEEEEECVLERYLEGDDG